jgi:ABC-type Mn2+/Zn2+ transport system ATPase subunit
MAVSICFQNISFSYNSNGSLFTSLDLLLPQDRTVVLTGENGTGKSTLANLVAGYLKPSCGKIIYYRNGLILNRQDKIYSEIAYLRQSVEDNVIGPTPFQDLLLWTSSYSRPVESLSPLISEILTEWKLEDPGNTPVWELSSGELKALALAGICANKNRFWILDEPLSSLDNQRSDILYENLIAKQKVNRGMLIISHLSDVLQQIADDMLILHPDGSIRKS